MKLDQIKSKLKSDKGDSDLFSWFDVFMFEYGISFEELKKMNIQAFYLLRDRITNRRQKEAEAMKRKK